MIFELSIFTAGALQKLGLPSLMTQLMAQLTDVSFYAKMMFSKNVVLLQLSLVAHATLAALQRLGVGLQHQPAQPLFTEIKVSFLF